MKTDYSTEGFAQWFFFKVSNTRKDQTYKFNIMNMLKPDFLYNQGMKILVYSTKRAEQLGASWRREGTRIAYFKNSIRRRGVSYYTLTFTLSADCKIVMRYLPDRLQRRRLHRQRLSLPIF